MFRRLFSSAVPAAARASQAPPTAAQATVDAALLPPVLQRLIRKELSKLPVTAKRSIRNPFIVHSFNKEVLPSRNDLPQEAHTQRVHTPPSFSVRRQKQLLEMYPAHHLPSSPTNPVTSLPVKLEDGTVVTWEGKWRKHRRRDLYTKRKVMFKGTQAERDHDQRIQEREDRLATMEKRIADWKKTKTEAKALTKPSLPF